MIMIDKGHFIASRALVSRTVAGIFFAVCFDTMIAREISHRVYLFLEVSKSKKKSQ